MSEECWRTRAIKLYSIIAQARMERHHRSAQRARVEQRAPAAEAGTAGADRIYDVDTVAQYFAQHKILINVSLH